MAWPAPAAPREWPSTVRDAAWPPRSSWELAYEVDFRALASQDFKAGGDKAYTLDGITWTAVNTSAIDAAGVFDLANGTGIRIEPAQATVFDHATKTAPYLKVVLGDLVPEYDVGDRLLVQVGLSPASLSQADQAYGLMAGSDSHANDNYAGAVGASYASSNPQVRTWQIWNATTLTEDAQASEPRVAALEWWPPLFSTWYHADASWPLPGQMSRACPSSSAGNFGPRASGWPWASSDAVLRLWAQRPGSQSAFTATFTALRILRQRL